MIKVTRRNGEMLYINADLIETMERHPDTTVVGLLGGDKLIVMETPDAIVDAVVSYRRNIRGYSTDGLGGAVRMFCRRTEEGETT